MNETKLFDAEARSLRYLNQLNELEIPFFQRPYVWEEENWKKLYESFFDNEIPDFLGSIILKHSSDGEYQSTATVFPVARRDNHAAKGQPCATSPGTCSIERRTVHPLDCRVPLRKETSRHPDCPTRTCHIAA